MQILVLLATVFLTFFGVYGVCLLLGSNNTASLKRKAYIRDLEWRNKQLDAGLNPDGMPFDFDHSGDYHNYNCTCPIHAKNNKLIDRDAKKLKKLLNY